MADIAKPIPADEFGIAANRYLTVRSTSSACRQLIAFQSAIDCGDSTNLRLAVSG
jgi:hypothetical protein